MTYGLFDGSRSPARDRAIVQDALTSAKTHKARVEAYKKDLSQYRNRLHRLTSSRYPRSHEEQLEIWKLQQEIPRLQRQIESHQQEPAAHFDIARAEAWLASHPEPETQPTQPDNNACARAA